LVGAAFAIVYARLLRSDREQSLTGLLGELMGMIVLPYLGPGAARREQARPVPVPSPGVGLLAGDVVAVRAERDPLDGLPMRLTYRTARVLEVVAMHPGVSNRRVAELSGIVDQGQVSKLLARLERLGLLANTGAGHARGERNEWCLTDRGLQVTQTIRAHAHNHKEAA
jgi:DNA-binding MarR family transcriptional regulator